MRRHLRWLRRWLAYLLAVVLVMVALVIGTLSQLLPLAERHPQRIAAWLSDKAGRPVAFERLQTQWTRRGPLLRLDGLHIGEGEQGVRVGQAEVLVSLYAGLFPGRSFTELRLRGPSLALQRADDGRWSIRGLPAAQASQVDPLEYLEGLGELQVIGGRLDVDAPQLGLQASIPRIDLRLRVDGARLQAGLRGWVGPRGQPLRLALEFDRGSGDGRGYIDLDSDDLAAWAPLLRHAGVAPVAGDGRMQGWVLLQGHRPVQVTSQFQFHRVVLSGAPLPGRARPQHAFDELRGRLRWRMADGGWRLDAPLLRMTDARGAQVLDGLTAAAGPRYALAARDIDATPLFALAALGDRLPASQRAWLLDAAPRLRVSKLELAGERGGALRVSGHLDGLAIAVVGDAPGVAGLSGAFQGDAQGWQLALDPGSALAVDWPRGFGVVHQVQLDGHLLGWREGAGWRVGTPALRIRGVDYGAHVRGGLWFQADGSRPWIDVAAELDDAPVPAAKKFWLRHSMSQAAVQWLDMALEDGSVRGGRALISGDLDDWPFTRRNGLFDARARIERGRFRFQQQWPALDDTAAEVAFVGNGFQVQGRGKLGGVPVRSFHAGIADYGDAPLQVRAQATADAARLLALLRRSPLHAEHAQTLDNLDASGPARASFVLNLPLHRDDAPARVEGSVELLGARLAEKRWNLAFEEVRGLAHYDSDGFAAAALDVVHGGQRGVLALRAGSPHVRDAAQSFEADLRVPMAAADLLARAPSLDWLKPYVRGRSTWNLMLAVPRARAGASASADDTVAGELRLRSNLVGTRLDLPSPLHKPAAQALGAAVKVALPLGSGDIDVAMGQRLAIRTRERNGATGVQVTLGSATVAAEPPASGIVIGGRTHELDALEWIGLVKGSGDGGLPLRQVDLLATRLHLLGGEFAQARLRLRPTPGAVAVSVDGPALAGSLTVPEQDGLPVHGHFTRLHWQPQAAATAEADNDTGAPAQAGVAATATAAAAIAAAPATGTDAAAATSSAASAAAAPAGAPGAAASGVPAGSFDPAGIPPLVLEIDDLRYRGAELGRATLRTRPVAGGLRVDALQLRSDWQRTDITGQWLGQGAAARTHLQMRVESEDMGRLVAGLGYADWLARGKGSIDLDARWPGSPAGFRLGALQGALHIDVRDGQLLEVEPGAGRVLGLLSVAQLPRRLILDFRDFFSRGFAFSQLQGSVRFADGAAHTDDMHIEGPAADILIRGHTDLRAQRFDQTIDVQPKSGNLLAVVGAVAGGPVGAAVGAAANAVLRKPLGEIGARTYRVSGPWKEPRVDVITRDPAPQEEATAPPPAAEDPAAPVHAAPAVPDQAAPDQADAGVPPRD
ncbi:YhdP family protein [Pseudoxanthomonas koreensis]|uniref:YhdP family protein n=1 Tax=Pseudoxanthomonas koreensis TaxID=266061 RepID=UPI0035A5F716